MPGKSREVKGPKRHILERACLLTVITAIKANKNRWLQSLDGDFFPSHLSILMCFLLSPSACFVSLPFPFNPSSLFPSLPFFASLTLSRGQSRCQA